MRLILLGTPGGGKGTQATLICDYFKIPHISTGEIFRSKVKEGTVLGLEIKEYMENGKLVPDHITISLIEDRLKEEDSINGFLLDGFPRDENQAKKLDELLNKKDQQIDKVFLIEVPEDVIIDRISGRRVCPKCGENYHVKYNLPPIKGKCGVCGSNLIHRQDDKKEIIMERLSIYNKTIKPILDFYSAKGILFKINGDDDIHVIFNNIREILEKN